MSLNYDQPNFRNLIDRVSYRPLTDGQVEKLTHVLGSPDLLFVGENHGLPSLRKAGEGVAVRFVDEMILIAAKANKPIKFIGLEVYVHPSAMLKDKHFPEEKVPYIKKWIEMGIQIVSIDSISSLADVRETEISENVLAAYNKYGTGIIIIGVHHAINLSEPLINELFPEDRPVTESTFQQLKKHNPELNVASVVALVKHPDMTLNEKTDGVACPVLIDGNDTKSLRVFDENKPNNILLIGGNADIGIIYPY